MVLKQDGSVWATGDNDEGQLGDGTTTQRQSFIKVVPSGVMAIAAGEKHSLVLKQDCSVWATGDNDDGQLGDGSTTTRDSFVEAKCPGCLTTGKDSGIVVV